MGEYNLKIKDLPEEERPRERMLNYGPEALSNTELLAIIIRTGIKGESALAVAQNLISQDGLEALLDNSIEELAAFKGMGTSKAVLIKAAIELGKRLYSMPEKKKYIIKSPADVSAILMGEMRYLKKEYFKTILLDIKNNIIAIENISIGSLNSSLVHPREIFKSAIKKSSAAIIMVHNHPSGDPHPSNEDIEVTRRIVESGRILGIEVLDHVIIGDGKYFSFKDEELIG
ncbi:MAG: DNA repair protein RadC [Thermoanaerobacteraceae bacterium]|nr:DNA repair protein RadC [Thermoanaerobacteraceae bacterium]